jgi:hypothetical protein
MAAAAVQLQGKWNVGIIVVEENRKPLISLISPIGDGGIRPSLICDRPLNLAS